MDRENAEQGHGDPQGPTPGGVREDQGGGASEGASSELIPDPFRIPADPQNLAAAPRAVHAFELRKAGASYEAIADKLGYSSPETARQAILQRIKKHYQLNEEAVEEIIGVELSRLDALQLLAWREATRDEDEVNLKAVDTILKIMERRSKLLGLDRQTDSGGPSTVNNTAVFVAGSKNEYLEGIRQATGLMKGSE